MAKTPTVPSATFKVDGAEYRFLVPQFYHNAPFSAEEALDKPELLAELVGIHRKVEGKPEVHSGLIALVESEVKAPAAPAGGAKLAPDTEVVKAIFLATSEDEVNALATGDTRDLVVKSAAERIRQLKA